MAGEVVIEHRYPQAGAFVREHGPDAVAVLEDMLCRAEVVAGALVVKASGREVATRLGFMSKDSANRRIRQLQRAGVLRLASDAAPSFAVPTYDVHRPAPASPCPVLPRTAGTHRTRQHQHTGVPSRASNPVHASRRSLLRPHQALHAGHHTTVSFSDRRVHAPVRRSGRPAVTSSPDR